MTLDAFSEILAPASKSSLAEDIVVRLREAIFNGKLAPGERLQEERLAKSMRVSRGPVREALTQLEREGLVIRTRNRGTFVARLSRADLDEVYSLRLAVEQLAVRQAARNIESGELAEMQKLVDTMNDLAQQGITEQQAAELDMHYHEILYQAARHHRLYDCWANLRAQIHIFLLGRNVADLDFRELIARDHQEILDALRAKDEELAVSLIEQHIQASYRRVVEGYEGHRHSVRASDPQVHD